jgi:hypothetical protein
VQGKTALERAFELADQGLNVREIRQALAQEQYDQGHVYGATITAQLKARASAAARKGNESRSKR